MYQHFRQHRYYWELRLAAREVMFPPALPRHAEDLHAPNMSLRVWRSVRTRAPATQTSFVAPFAGASLRTRPRRVNSPRRPFLIPLPP